MPIGSGKVGISAYISKELYKLVKKMAMKEERTISYIVYKALKMLCDGSGK